MKRILYSSLYIALVIFSVGFASCKKFIEVEPPATSINEDNVYRYDGSSISTVIGIYASMANSNFSGNLTVYPELSADNMRMLNQSFAATIPYYKNNLSASEGIVIPWMFIYPQIFTCNAVIEGLNASKTVTSTVKQNLLGQAYFLRAYYYFYLTNFYGDVPLSISTNSFVNNSLKRSPATTIYSQIVSDLKQAKSLLPEGYLTGDMINTFPAGQEQRVVPNRSAVNALLARVYIFQKDWADAETAATEVLEQTSLYSASVPLSQIFLKNSKETIWSLQPVKNGWNTDEADQFTLRPGEPTPNSGRSAYFSDEFMNFFQIGDQRKVAWINTSTVNSISYPYPAKYKTIQSSASEYSIFLRVAEQYLIRAEARFQLNKIADGIADLNVLRDRAIDKNEPDPTKRLKLLEISLPKEQALLALAYEKRVEMFAEGAYRWLDLKRTGEIDQVMSEAAPLKGATWDSHKALFPIPAEEIIRNKNLVQNTGYTN